MPTQKKLDVVQRLAELFSESKVIIATNYRGLSVADISQLRRQLRDIGVEYHVIKNTLAKLAAEKASKAELSPLLQGPTALAFGYGDVVQPAKALDAYRRSSMTTLSIKGGLVDSRLFTAEEVSSIAALPSIEVLRAKLLGMLTSPIFNLQNVLSANLRSLGALLEARIKQLGGTPDDNR